MNSRFLSALFAFLALPGLVAFALPALWLASQGAQLQQPWGLLTLCIGVIGLGVCVIDFYRKGRGTLAPWAPPERLVVVGLYRWSRNPMYIAVLLILIGWAWAFQSLPLAIYAGMVAVAFHLRVVLGEEPWLARQHGQDWIDYSGRVRRWF